MRDLKKLEADFPDEAETKKFVDDLEPLLKKAIEQRKKNISVALYKKSALDLKKDEIY